MERLMNQGYTYMMGTDEYTKACPKGVDNGETVVVINEEEDVVQGIYIAYKGRWFPFKKERR